MPKSQNATFYGVEAHTPGEQIRGMTIARLLSAELSESVLQVSQSECWRDSGWVFTVQSDISKLEIVVLADQVYENRWILQISPSYLPGIISQWFGATTSATAQEVFQVAVQCHQALASHGFVDFQWCWDDFADGEHCSTEPTPPA